MDANKTPGEEARRQLHKNATCNLKQVLAATNPQDTSCTATCPLSRKLFKLDEPDMQDTAGEARYELIRDVLLWTPTHGRAKAGRPARTYIQQLCEDTGYCPEDLPRAMNDREEWRESVRDIRATSAIWWWFEDIQLYEKKVALSARAVEYTDWFSVEEKKPSQWISWIWRKIIWWWGPCNAGDLRNAEHPFISIAPKSFQAWSGSIWYSSIYVSNRTKLLTYAKLNFLK